MDLNLNDIENQICTKQAVLIDVREYDEWEKAHFTDAILFPLSKLIAKEISFSFPENVALYLHCEKGSRAKRAENILNTGILRLKSFQAISLQYTFGELQAAWSRLSLFNA